MVNLLYWECGFREPGRLFHELLEVEVFLNRGNEG
jgi:hypothetical protein